MTQNTMTFEQEAYAGNTADGQLRVEPSLLQRARSNERAAVETMFRQFVSEDEEVLFAEYLGTQGLWWVGSHGFACLTNRRLASITIGPWGEVLFQDGLLEHYNSAVVHQPSKLMLYVIVAMSVLAAIPSFGISVLLLPYLVQSYYRIRKCGLVVVIREGVSVYMFSNRNKLTRANALLRLAAQQRERRLEALPVRT